MELELQSINAVILLLNSGLADADSARVAILLKMANAVLNGTWHE